MPKAGAPGGGSLSGVSKAGCGAAVAVMAAILIGGFVILDRGVDWLVVRASERVEESLPADLDAPSRIRLKAGLEAFTEGLPDAPDRDAATGAFLARVGAALEDRRLTVAEAGELADFLEATCAAWGGERVVRSPVPEDR